MEGSTKAGVMLWTPAPMDSSHTSSVGSDSDWDDGREEEQEEEIFQSQMDENGIIGLEDDQNTDLDHGMDGYGHVLEKQNGRDLSWDTGTPEPEPGPPMALEDLSCDLSELLDSDPIGEDANTPSQNEEHSVEGAAIATLQGWSDEEEGVEEAQGSWIIHTQAQRDSELDATDEDEGDREEEIMHTSLGPTDSRFPHLVQCHVREVEAQGNYSETKGHQRKIGDTKHSLTQLFSSCSFPLPSSDLSDSISSSEDLPNKHQTQGDILSERQHQGMHSTHPCTLASQEIQECSALAYHTTNHRPSSYFVGPGRQSKQGSHRLQKQLSKAPNLPGSSFVDASDVRKGKLSHAKPDFSMVRPRVRFPKEDYRPPKSRCPAWTKGTDPEHPLVFKSPAEIVRDVLLSSAEDMDTPSKIRSLGQVNTTLPQEFRTPQQATVLVQQLQEDYNKLLTKYAEAENTIDRLRLEAKVTMYSDPPNSSHSILSGVFQDGSKVMTLTFPQAHRAELSHGLNFQAIQENLSSGGVSPTCHSSQSLMEALAERLLQKVTVLEDLLRKGKLSPHEQVKSLAHLTQGLGNLERSYLSAIDDHRCLQEQLGGQMEPFDPDRDLEGQIFHLGMQLDELKELVDQKQQRGPTSGSAPTSPHNSTPFCLSPREGDLLPHPKSPVCPVGLGGLISVELEVSSVSGESESEMEEEVLPSPVLSAHRHKHRQLKGDFSSPPGRLRELPTVPDMNVSNGMVSSLEPDFASPTEYDGIAETQNWVVEESNVQGSPSQSTPLSKKNSSDIFATKRIVSADTQSDLPKSSNLRGTQMLSSSSLCSYGESQTCHHSAPKAHSADVTAPSQDGVLSPETDSGFLGSDMSRFVPTVHQQGALMRNSVLVETLKPEAFSESGPPLSSYSPQRCFSLGAQGPDPNGRTAGSAKKRGGRREVGGRGRVHSSCTSPQQSTDGTLQGFGSSRIGVPAHESEDVHSLAGHNKSKQGDHYTQSNNQRIQNVKKSSPAASYLHGDALKALSSGILTNHSDALSSLEVEMNRLKVCLEGSLRQPFTSTPAEPTPSDSALPNTSHTLYWRRGAENTDPERRRGEWEERSPQPAPWRRSSSTPQLSPDIATDSECAQVKSRQRTPRFPAAHRESGQEAADGQQSRRCRPNIGHRLTVSDLGGGASEDDVSCWREDSGFPRSASNGPERGFVTCPSHPATHRCPLCGGSGPYRAADADFHTKRDSGTAARKSRLVHAPRRQAAGMFMPTPPAPVLGSVPLFQCVPVYPSALSCYPTPVKATPIVYTAPISYSTLGVSNVKNMRNKQGHDRKHKRSTSEGPRSLSSSLRRAITAATVMKDTSHRMAQCLSSGLEHQQKMHSY
ncbi:AT-hook-containing transcription factor isoform X3 [Denticeps clupeoides]|uniref:AT-hook-containing transcription factor isoform X3 n=1 Tax=Denticeps clupeoides TaxID=299321 RepID=UPI0010A2CFD8|nr:AT-hook-containing transcription factor isoform X3 [Denticeps clupeoides]